MSKTFPLVTVTRDNFFATSSGGGHLRWAEASPRTAHQHGFECGCTQSVTARPSGSPASVRQEIRILWDDCVIALEDEVAEPWVTFRRAGDAESWIARKRVGTDEEDDDHAYIRFDGRQERAKLEVSSPGFGLIGCVLIDLFLGNQIDISRLYNGFMPSQVVKLSRIGPDQVWLYTDELMRVVEDADEAAALRDGFRLAREMRRLARPYLMMQTAAVDDVRSAVEHDEPLLGAATALRQGLSQFALNIESTELFRLAGEMEVELSAQRGVHEV